jgi:hypothetical protein
LRLTGYARWWRDGLALGVCLLGARGGAMSPRSANRSKVGLKSLTILHSPSGRSVPDGVPCKAGSRMECCRTSLIGFRLAKSRPVISKLIFVGNNTKRSKVSLPRCEPAKFFGSQRSDAPIFIIGSSAGCDVGVIGRKQHVSPNISGLKNCLRRGRIKRRRFVCVHDFSSYDSMERKGWALANISDTERNGRVSFKNHRHFDFYLNPRSLLNRKVVLEVVPLPISYPGIDGGCGKAEEGKQAKQLLNKNLLILLFAVFGLCGIVGFFKSFNLVGKWNEWIVFGCAVVSGLCVTASGMLIGLILLGGL